MAKKKPGNFLARADQALRKKRTVAAVYIFLRFAVIVVMVAQFFNGNFENVFLCLLTLVLFLLPTMVERSLQIDLPNTLEIIIMLFIFAAEILGEILHCGAKTRKTQEKYAELLERFGSEMSILQDVPEHDLRHVWPELGEAVARMRAGRVIRHAGYDGEYGVIRLFEEGENAPSLLSL